MKKKYDELVIFGNKITRPRNHPDQQHWQACQETIRAKLIAECGKVICGTCWLEEKTSPYRFELHHRHYNNFGKELLEDLILLCVPCHDAITNRIRWAKYDKDWRDEDTLKCIIERPVHERTNHIPKVGPLISIDVKIREFGGSAPTRKTVEKNCGLDFSITKIRGNT